MAENTHTIPLQNREDVRREDLKQKHDPGQEPTRGGSTGSDVQATEWKPGDAERNRNGNSQAGSKPDTGTNAGNGGDDTGPAKL